MGRFDGNPKPMCQRCLRRVWGVEKDGGWWCSNCDCWVVRPLRKRKKATPLEKKLRAIKPNDERSQVASLLSEAARRLENPGESLNDEFVRCLRLAARRMRAHARRSR